MTTAPAPFRPLEVELDDTLGWNDGSSLNVVEHATNDGMVFHHERIHGLLINATFDGTLLKLLRVAGPRLADPLHANELDHASRHLFEGSRFAHECAATYLGVMCLMTEQERAAALSRLSDQYQGYYDFMSGIVDSHCKSSFLRYLIAQSIAYFWFSSRALIEFARNDYCGTTIMCDEFCPDWRARASAPWLTQDGVAGAIAASVDAAIADERLCRAAQHFSPSDLEDAWNDDSWWIRQSRAVNGFIEELISETTFRYFIKYSGLSCAEVELIRNTDLSEMLIKPLYARAGVAVMSINEDRRESPHMEVSWASASRDFVVMARTVSHIQPRIAASPAGADKVLGMGDLDAFIGRQGIVDIIFPEAESPGAAYFKEFKAQPAEAGSPAKWVFSRYHRCTPQLASEALRRIMQRRISGEPGMKLDCVVIPVHFADNFSGYHSLMRFLCESPDPAKAASPNRSLVSEFSRSIEQEFLYAYVRDDWEKVVGPTERELPVTHVGTIEVNISGREPFLLNVARIAGFPSPLLKAYPMHARPAIEDYYRRCFEQGYLHQLKELPYGPALLDQSRRAFVAITAAWHQL